MTKEQVIKMLNDCENDTDAPYGFMLVSISREDIALYHNSNVLEKFDTLSKEKKEKVLSEMADSLADNYENVMFFNEFKSFENDLNEQIEREK